LRIRTNKIAAKPSTHVNSTSHTFIAAFFFLSFLCRPGASNFQQWDPYLSLIFESGQTHRTIS